MSSEGSLPFDIFRPFKSTPEAFTPRDSIPWEELAERVLRYPAAECFPGMRPRHEVDAAVAWVAERLGLRRGATILDLGCGPGMHSNRLAARGYQVTGIDIAGPFLEHAHAEAQALGVRCDYRQLSMLDMAFAGEFAAALLLQSIASCLESDDLRRLLAAIRRALQPGGRLIGEFRVQPGRFESRAPAANESLVLLDRSPWSDQPHAWLLRDLCFTASDEHVQHHMVVRSDGPPIECWSRFRLYAPEELRELLASCGFQVRAAFGPIPGRPLRPNDRSCVVWAQAAE
jgi:SAM-dependent methyltransferase